MFAVYSLLLAFIPIILLEIWFIGIDLGVYSRWWSSRSDRGEILGREVTGQLQLKWRVRYVFFNFALKSRSIMEWFFILFCFDASDNYRDANCRKKVHGVVCFGLSHQIFIEELLAAQQIFRDHPCRITHMQKLCCHSFNVMSDYV